MAPFSIGTFVETFLDREKEDARRLIRHEMESMLDPLVESLFKQLKDKFVDYVEASSDSGYSRQEPLHQHAREGGGQMIHDQEAIVNAQQYHCESLEYALSIDANSQINSANYLEPPLVLIKEEINDSLNVQLETQQNDNSVNSPASARKSSLIPESMISPTSTDNFSDKEMLQQQLFHIKPNQFDDEDECDCDECVYGAIDVKEEDDEDDDDSVQLIEDEQEEESSPRPVKRPRMDSTPNPSNFQPEITNQCPRQATDEAQANQMNIHDKQFITVRLHCPELGCLDTFGENELNDHLMDEHSIGPFRCLVKDCKQSFDNPRILAQHIKQAHHGINKFHCDKCEKHFSKYQLLYVHNIDYHQPGNFHCTFLTCTFTGAFKRQMYNHYQLQHKPDLVCQVFGCEYRTKKSGRFKAHQRAHLGIKPYRCKWSNCDFSSVSQDYTICHIKTIHFRSMTSLVSDVALLGKPKDYLDVVHDLL